MKHTFIFLAIFCFTTLGFGQTKLQYNLNKGDVFMVQQHAKQTIIQELDGAPHEITNNIDGILSFTVSNVSVDTYKILVSFKDLNLKMESSIQGTLMNVNAKDIKEGDVQSKIFNALLDNSVEMTLSKTGNILAVVGGDSLVNRMTAASGLNDEFSVNIMKKSLKKEFGSEALSNSYKQMTYIYPEKPVKKGDTWQNVYTGKLNADNIWVLKDITEESALITGTANITMNIVEPATTMALTGTQETNIETDIRSGFIEKMEVKSTSKGSSTIVQIGEQKIPTTIESITTYQLIKQ